MQSARQKEKRVRTERGFSQRKELQKSLLFMSCVMVKRGHWTPLLRICVSQRFPSPLFKKMTKVRTTNKSRWTPQTTMRCLLNMFSDRQIVNKEMKGLKGEVPYSTKPSKIWPTILSCILKTRKSGVLDNQNTYQSTARTQSEWNKELQPDQTNKLQLAEDKVLPPRKRLLISNENL